MTENHEGTSYVNTAESGATVGTQVGVVNGNVTVYEVSGEDPPEKKYEVALNCLRGNMPRRAEELIRQVVAAGHQSVDIAYHWTLAILSGRSFDHLGQAEFTGLQEALKLAGEHPSGAWSTPMEVVFRLINCLTTQEQAQIWDPAEFDEVLAAFERLDEDRKEEIRRHLDMILTGGVQDRIDAVYAAQAAEQRMGGDRTERVWKFFEPEPAPPRGPDLVEPVLKRSGRVQAVIAALPAVVALLLLLAAGIGSAPGTLLLVLLLLAGGLYALARFGVERNARVLVLKEHDLAYGRALPASPEQEEEEEDEDDSLPDEQDEHDDREEQRRVERTRRKEEFRAEVRDYTAYRFHRHRPRRGSGRDGDDRRRRWEEETAAIKASIIEEVIGRYGTPPPAPGALRWLIRFRVETIARAWRDGKLHQDRERLAVPAATAAGYLAGWAALLLGSGGALLVALEVSPQRAVEVAVLPLVALWIATINGLHRHWVDLRAHQLRAQTARERLDQERQAYDQWRKVLADRPTDAEMARWLDYDLIHIKAEALKHYTMANRDVIAHATLTEAEFGCLRARVLYGPPRYNAYVVTMFLLNESGVRQVSTHLDFETGITGNEQRTHFRYDAIASARVSEVGIRLDQGRRKVVLPAENDEEHEVDLKSLIMSHAFQLSLVSGQTIDVVVENFDRGLIDRMLERPQQLYELALDTSGIRGALRILEAVAAEGRDWIAQEKARRQRRLVVYGRDRPPPSGLGQAPPAGALTNGSTPPPTADATDAEGVSPLEELLIRLAADYAYRPTRVTPGLIELVNDLGGVAAYLDRDELLTNAIVILVSPATSLTRLAVLEGVTVPSSTAVRRDDDLRLLPGLGTGTGRFGYPIGCADLVSYGRLLDFVGGGGQARPDG
ncbi:hypothetical protein [Nonomuraea sp. NPDC002799]